MEQLLRRVQDSAAKAVLTREEKDAVRRFLIDRMSGPVPFAARAKASWSGFVGSLGRAFAVAPSFGRPATALATVALFVSVSGGIVLAAEGSLPGDALYGLKTGFTEPVYGALSLTRGSQARWQVQMVERRLQEAEKMVAAGTLDGPKRIDLEQVVLKQTQKAVREVENMGQDVKSKDQAVQLSSDLESSLRGHGARLGRILDGKGADRAATDDHLAKEAAEQASAARIREEKSVIVDRTGLIRRSENAAASAEKKIKTVRDLLAAKSLRIGADDRAAAEAKLSEASRLMIEGRAKAASGDLDGAFGDFQQSARSAQEARVFVRPDDARAVRAAGNGAEDLRGQMPPSGNGERGRRPVQQGRKDSGDR